MAAPHARSLRAALALAAALTTGCIIETTSECTSGTTRACACPTGTGLQACIGGRWDLCSCGGGICAPGATQPCACPGGRTGAQTCVADGSGFGACACSSTVCAPGATQPCTCAGGRPGAATCVADGSGYGACACAQACAPGATQACACPDGTAGTQTCASDGRGYGACACSARVCTPGTTRPCTCAGGASGAQACNGAGTGYGTCACAAPTCSRSVGQSCATDAECCPNRSGMATRCVGIPGQGQVCATRCTAGGVCDSNCCVALADGSGSVCAPAYYCRSSAGCTASVDGMCRADTDCCPDARTMYPAICAGVAGSGTFFCRQVCTRNSDCTSNCCRTRDDGVLHCRPRTECL